MSRPGLSAGAALARRRPAAACHPRVVALSPHPVARPPHFHPSPCGLRPTRRRLRRRRRPPPLQRFVAFAAAKFRCRSGEDGKPRYS